CGGYDVRRARRADGERWEGVPHLPALRGRTGQRVLPTARGLEGLWEVPEPQDLGRRDALRADPVFVQPGATRPRSTGAEQKALGRSRGDAEPLQNRGTRVSERVPVVTGG